MENQKSASCCAEKELSQENRPNQRDEAQTDPGSKYFDPHEEYEKNQEECRRKFWKELHINYLCRDIENQELFYGCVEANIGGLGPKTAILPIEDCCNYSKLHGHFKLLGKLSSKDRLMMDEFLRAQIIDLKNRNDFWWYAGRNGCYRMPDGRWIAVEGNRVIGARGIKLEIDSEAGKLKMLGGNYRNPVVNLLNILFYKPNVLLLTVAYVCETLVRSAVRQAGSEFQAVGKLADLLKEKKMTRKSLSEGAGVPINTVYSAVKGNPVPAKTAIALSKELGMDVNEVFDTQKKLHTLSANTVQHYHRLISMVLEQAVKEGLIPQNVSKRATLPKLQRKEVNHFQPEELLKICEALQGEPIKWRALVMVLMMSGCRRGEVLGLKWDKVDFAQNTILIDNNVLYVPKVGIYEDTPKTAKSRRLIALPPDTIELLRKYKAWQEEEIKALKGYYQDRGFLFAQEDGGPMHPDSVNTWLDRFSQRHGLPHINPHAFRHSMASVLYYNGMDSVSISARLGHTQVSTTSDIYAHVIEQADHRSAEILENLFRKKD